jgi:NAD(P)H-flavin reductase/ferredoxin/truncated hemoglobin YjbI
MAILKYQGREARTREGETVLDAFLRQGITVPFSCRSGTCHVCLQHCVQGAIPPVAQNGLSKELRDRNYFKTCKCVPLGDMEIAPPTELYRSTLVYSKEMLSPLVCKLLIEPPSSLDYRAGQFVNLRRSDGLTRSYSLASLPGEDYFLEIHVLRKHGGEMSNWIFDTLEAGDEIGIQGPAGESYYRHEERSHPMLMVATGTGLAPIYGILRDALHNKHKGEIHLYHGGRDEERFYLRGPLRELERQHPHFHYYECVSGTRISPPGAPAHGTLAGRVHDVAFARHANLHGWHVHIAGLAEMVDAAEQLAVKHGAAPDRIYTDAFALRDLRSKPRDGKKPEIPVQAETAEGKPKYPPPDPELWAALGEGEVLHEVLSDFYTKVYRDERLASFFEGVTKQRLIEKQFLFMRQIITGEKIYFGDQPRNTHHWMVISDDLFDYRGEMMKDSLRKFGLSGEMVERFNAIEDYYREDVVKDTPFPKKIGDTEMPLEGFDELVLDVGTLCDACQREVAAGEKVIYHVRLGKIYCSDCSEPHEHPVPA